MILLSIATASAAVAPPAWVGTLTHPLVGGVIVAVLVQLAKAVPAVPTGSGGKIAAIAAILSVVVGGASAYAQGALDTFGWAAAWNILVGAVGVLTAGMGTYEATKQAARAVHGG